MAQQGSSLRSIAWVHEPVATAGRHIRRQLRVLLAGWGLAAAVVEDALMVVEELVANAVDHARTRFQLVVRLSDEVLHVAVRDCGAGFPQVRPPDPRAVRGRGLQVVTALAQRWGCERHERGKTVWAELTV